MRVAQRPSVSDVPKGTLYHHLIFKGLGRGSGELCHRLAPTHTHAREDGREGLLGEGGEGGGDLDLQAGTRDLSAGTQAWTLLQLARGEQAGFLHTRHDISELIPSSPRPSFPLSFPPPSPSTSSCKTHSADWLPICFLALARRRGWDLNST